MDADGKRNRVDPCGPSKVIHVRGLPADCYEQEILQAATHFGRVANILMLRAKSQCFIEMSDLDGARSLVEFHSSNPAYLRNAFPIFFQYSKHTQLNGGGSNGAGSAGYPAKQRPQQGNQQPSNHVILVTIQNVLFPISIDTLVQIFSKYGAVVKIILFNSKSGATQALVQFSDVMAAVTAKQVCDGHNIYAGCCSLRIQFSNLTDLNVKFNNERSRDLLNPYLPPGSGELQGPTGSMHGAPVSHPGHAHPHAHAHPHPHPHPHGPANQMFLNKAQGGMMNPMAGMGPMGMGGLGLHAAAGGLSGLGIAQQQQQEPGRCVIIVSNLNAEQITPDILFTLFGVYGDVVRVKIIFNKKDSALIQFQTQDQAATVLRHLHQCPLFGQPMSLNLSNHSSISGPRNPEASNEGGSELTKDYSNSPFHRFKFPGSRNFKNICPPSPVLHLSNIPADVTEEALRTLFESYGEVVALKFLDLSRKETAAGNGQNSRQFVPSKMALLQMGLDNAVSALVFLHNHRFGTTNLKVSFSKFTSFEAPSQQQQQ